MKIPPLSSLWPIGHIAGHAGASVTEIEAIADELKIVPVLGILGVPYFDMVSAIRIEEFITAKRNGTTSPLEPPPAPKPTNVNLH